MSPLEVNNKSDGLVLNLFNFLTGTFISWIHNASAYSRLDLTDLDM